MCIDHMELLTDEQICKLDVVPQILPDFFLGRTFDVNKIASDLDMGAIHNWQIGPELLDEWYEPWHLRIICDIERIILDGVDCAEMKTDR
jgi:hypothetical protein